VSVRIEEAAIQTGQHLLPRNRDEHRASDCVPTQYQPVRRSGATLRIAEDEDRRAAAGVNDQQQNQRREETVAHAAA
jgi:hypothetical protein